MNSLFFLISFYFQLIFCQLLTNNNSNNSSNYNNYNKNNNKSSNNKIIFFSGLYTPNIKYSLEIYSASWLQKKERYLNLYNEINVINALESSTTGPLLKYQYSKTNHILMTRDYYDFNIEHLSSTTNQIKEDQHFIEYLSNLLIDKVEFLKKNSLQYFNNLSLKPFYLSTVVIIPFSVKSASMGGDYYRIKDLRVLYLKATFWSIYRYFPNIIVYVSTIDDYKLIENLNLPLNNLVYSNINFNTSWELPRYSLLHAYQSFQKNKTWSNYKYIYYTEADQILHMRSQLYLKYWLDNSDEDFALVPHRMITMIYPQSLPDNLKEYFPSWRHKASQSSVLHVETSPTIAGSCCDMGRFKFPDCDTWWYDCEKGWGINNLTTWYRHGKTGFTMPTVTEHSGRCNYSKERILCDIPSDCKHRIPLQLNQVCTEIPLIN